MTLPYQIAHVRDGARIAYAVHSGTGSARLALVHSLALDASFWNRVVPYLSDVAEVLVYDARGHGRSDPPPVNFTVEDHARDLGDVLDAAGWSRCAVAGASMGGCISLAFASADPKRVTGLGLIDTTAWYGPQAPAQWEERGQKGAQEGMAALVAFQKSRWWSEAFVQAHPQVVAEAVAAFLATDPQAYLETCRMLGRADLRAALPRFDVPTRIVVGADDYATPVDMARAMCDAIPGATLRVLPGVRHLTPLECPELVAEELRILLRDRP
jgi:3-oxoadipate enol-lactonase